MIRMTPSGFPGKQPFMSGRFHILSDGVSRWRATEKAGKPLQQTYKKRCSRHNVILVILDSTSSKGAGISYLDGVKNCTLRHRATWAQCARTRSSPICGNSAIYGGIYKGAPVTVNFLGAEHRTRWPGAVFFNRLRTRPWTESSRHSGKTRANSLGGVAGCTLTLKIGNTFTLSGELSQSS